VAYQSDESGRAEVYVVPFPEPGGKRQISSGGGFFPRWRRDGKDIFYVSPDNRLMAVTVEGKGTGFQVGAVQALFQLPMTGVQARYTYDVSADGQRFLLNTIPEQRAAAQTPLTLVINWPALLKK
jgi:Tol biopolymer transport system component